MIAFHSTRLYCRWAMISIGVAAVAGCTTELDVALVNLERADPRPGWAYSLPYARFDITVTRRLTKCDDDGISIDLTFVASPSFEADPARSFVIDHQSLSSLMKTSNLSIENHDNKMIKTVGAASEDVTGKVIVNTITGVVNLAKAAQVAGGGFGSFVDSSGPPAKKRLTKLKCIDGIKALIGNYDAQAQIVKDKASALSQAAKQMKSATDVSAFLGQRVTTDVQKELFRLAQLVATEQAALDTETAKLKELLKKVAAVDSFKWPNDGDDINWKRDFASEAYRDWFTNPKELVSDLRLRLASDTKLGIDKVKPSEAPKDQSKEAAKQEPPTGRGIRYREPVQGSLIIEYCMLKAKAPPVEVVPAPIEKCDKNGAIEDATYEKGGFSAATTSIPQLGRLHFLPFSNGPFENNELKAVFRNDGSLLSASYGEKAAPAEVASAAFSQAAAILAQGARDLRTNALNLKTEEYKAREAELKAKESLEKATKEYNEDRALIESDTALKKAQLANIEARQALEKARQSAP